MKKTTKRNIIVVILFIVVMIVFFRHHLYERILLFRDMLGQSEEEGNYKKLEKIYEEIKEPLGQIVEETKYDVKGKEGFVIDFPEEGPGKGSKYSPEEIVFYNGEVRDVNSAIYKEYFLSKPGLVDAVKTLEEKEIIDMIYFEIRKNGAYEAWFWINPKKTKFITYNNGFSNPIMYLEKYESNYGEGYGYHSLGDNWYVNISSGGE